MDSPELKPRALPDSLRELASDICGCATDENTWALILAELERLDRNEFKEEDDLACTICDIYGFSEHMADPSAAGG